MEATLPNHFWNRKYITMCLMNLFVTLAVSMQYPLIVHPSQTCSVALAVILFIAGMFLPGPFNAFLVDRFRRKGICEAALVGFIIVSAFALFLQDYTLTPIVRFFQGLFFGLFEMSLGATLINDLSVSKKRTATDYFFTWFGLVGIPAGVGLTTILSSSAYSYYLPFIPLVLSFLALLLLLPIGVPFRAPNENPLISLDRFFTPRAIILIFNLLPAAIIPGLFVSGSFSATFMLVMAAGIVLGIILHRMMFVEADHRADAVAGFILIICGLLLLRFPRGMNIENVSAVLVGLGTGWIESRLLLYFLKMSEHCQRGTLQQTYILTLYLGINIGLLLSTLGIDIFILGIILAIVSLFLFLFVTQPWFRHIKGREFKFKEI